VSKHITLRDVVKAKMPEQQPGSLEAMPQKFVLENHQGSGWISRTFLFTRFSTTNEKCAHKIVQIKVKTTHKNKLHINTILLKTDR